MASDPKAAKPKKKPARTTTHKVAAEHRDEPVLPMPTGEGDDLIPVSILVRYNTFVSHYLDTLDLVEASKQAGWVGKNVQAQRALGGALLRNPYVRTMIERQYQAIIAKTAATTERVWQEIAGIAFLDPAEAFNPDGTPKPMEEMPEHVRRAIIGRKRKVMTFGEDGEAVEEEIKFASKDAALEKLMRLHRMTDNDKYVLVSGDEFVAAMEEGRQRAAGRGQ